MAGKFAQDFFISYCHRDRLHVEEKLVVPLKEKGVEVAWDRDRAGKIAPNLLARLTEWVNTSQITIVVLSKRYAEAYTKKSTGYLRYEFDTAEQLQVESGQTRVVVLHLDDCRVPDPRMSKYLRGTCVDDELLDALVYEVRKEGVPAFRLTAGGSALAVGAHWDDLLLGCLGTLLKLKLVMKYDVSLLVLCKAYGDYYYRAKQTRLKEKADRMYRDLCRKCDFKDMSYLSRSVSRGSKGADLTDRRLRQDADKIRAVMERAMKYSRRGGRRPFSLIFTPPIDDMNDDHAVTGEAVFSCFRDPHHTILEYAIKRYTERELSPNLCVSLGDKIDLFEGQTCSIAEAKVRLIEEVCEVTDEKKGVKNSGRLFSREALQARGRKDALDYAKDWKIIHAEAFRGRIEL